MAARKTWIKVEQIASPIRRHYKQRETLIGLGLNQIGRIAHVPDTPQSRGMIAKVKHLVRIVRPQVKPLLSGAKNTGKDYRRGRQTAQLKMTDAEFNGRFGALASAFDESWLESGNHPLQALWQRKDPLAVNQLALLGHSVAGLTEIDSRWVRFHVTKIKGSEINERRGSMFELLGVDLFRFARQTIRPTRVGTAGFDAIIIMPDHSQVDLSLKSYGTSTHELEFRKQAAETEQTFIAAARANKCVGLHLGAIASVYPSRSHWEELRAAIPGMISNPSTLLAGIWTAKVADLPPEFGPYSDRHLSHQVLMLAPFHMNESKNLYDKFEEACVNAREHAKEREDSVRVVLLRVPETISLDACSKWTTEYIRAHQSGPVEGIYLYQMTVADLPNGQSVISHALAHAETPSFAKWRNPLGSARRIISMNFAVGSPTNRPTQRQLVGGPTPLALNDGYVYQRGELFTVFEADPRRITNATLSNLASGILQHAVLRFPGGRQDIIGGYFPPLKEITLFD